MNPTDKKFIYLIFRNLKNIDSIPINKDKETMKFILQDKFLNKDILKNMYKYAEELSDEEFHNIRESVEHPPKERSITDVLRKS
jgi:hypothetical protein